MRRPVKLRTVKFCSVAVVWNLTWLTCDYVEMFSNKFEIIKCKRERNMILHVMYVLNFSSWDMQPPKNFFILTHRRNFTLS